MIIDRRFNGPPETANGGYTAGRLGEALSAAGALRPDQAAQVTLRVPPPLASPLQVERAGDGLRVSVGAQLVAEATGVAFASDPVPPVGYDAAASAAQQYPGLVEHPFPTCYVCGPARPARDGLAIYPGPLPDGRTAAPWRVPADVSAVTVWAALDCPGGWAVLAPGRPYVLGRMAARVSEVPAPGTDCVVMGAMSAQSGRKAVVRTALYRPDPAGPQLLAEALATWLAI